MEIIVRSVTLTIYLSENDTYNGRAAYEAVVEYLRDSGIAGATVLHGIEGYGVHSKIHTANILRLGSDLPIVIMAVDTEEKIKSVTPILREMIPKELITIQAVDILSGENV